VSNTENQMVDIPRQPPATLEDLKRWQALKVEIARLTPTALILQEKELRARLVASFFPTPKEGTNKFPLNNGWQLKFTNTIKREVDYGMFQAMADKFREAGIGAAACIRQKWELEKKVYNTLTAEQQQVFDQCLTIKPESPQLEIELPAAEKKKQEAIASLAAAQATGVVNNPPVPGIQL